MADPESERRHAPRPGGSAPNIRQHRTMPVSQLPVTLDWVSAPTRRDPLGEGCLWAATKEVRPR